MSSSPGEPGARPANSSDASLRVSAITAPASTAGNSVSASGLGGAGGGACGAEQAVARASKALQQRRASSHPPSLWEDSPLQRKRRHAWPAGRSQRRTPVLAAAGDRWPGSITPRHKPSTSLTPLATACPLGAPRLIAPGLRPALRPIARAARSSTAIDRSALLQRPGGQATRGLPARRTRDTAVLLEPT